MYKMVLHLACLTFLALTPATLLARNVTMQSGPLVDHPVSHPAIGRSAGNFRTKVGAWGENFSDQTLKLRGFSEIHEIKHGGNNGIDRIAIKRGADGAITDVRLVEVKTTRSSKPKLGNTKYGGKQMSRRWLAANLRMMRNAGDPELKKLALDISRFRKTANVPITSMGEVLHINTRTGKMTGYAADGRTVKYVQSTERLLKNIQSKAGDKAARDWATRSLSRFDQIRATTMSNYLGKTASQQSSRSLLAKSSQNVRYADAARSALLGQSDNTISNILKRSAGRVAIVIAFAIDAKEIAEVEYAYRIGSISVRQRNVELFSKAGGLGGAFAGASGGAAAGAWIGTLGGPFAWFTVPAGGLAGGVIVGIGGYFGGSAIAGYGATAWYISIDKSVQEKFELSWLNETGVIR